MNTSSSHLPSVESEHCEACLHHKRDIESQSKVVMGNHE